MAKWVWVPPVIEQKRLMEQILTWSQLSRREGLLALENQIPRVKDEFTKRGLQLLVERTDFRENIKIEILNVSKEDLLEDFSTALGLI